MWALGLHPAFPVAVPPAPGAPHLRLTVPGLASSLGGMSVQTSPTIRIGAGLPVLPPPSGV